MWNLKKVALWGPFYLWADENTETSGTKHKQLSAYTRSKLKILGFGLNLVYNLRLAGLSSHMHSIVTNAYEAHACTYSIWTAHAMGSLKAMF